MGEKDIKAKDYMDDNAHFADACNFFLFQGQEVIKPEDLLEQDTSEILSVFGVGTKEIQIQKWRDLLKNVIIKNTKKCNYVIIGIENQTDIHYAMPVRNMIYDAINYGNQVKEAARIHKDNKDLKTHGEFLSGFLSTDRLTPVLTLTIYWGTEPWDGPRSLHDMIGLAQKDVIRQYIADYRLNLIVPAKITDFTKFRTSLGAVLEMIKYANDEKRMEEALTRRSIYRELDHEAIKTIALFTGIDIEIDDKEDGKMDMCKAWEDHKQAGKREGIREGRREGLSQGENNVICKMYSNGISIHDITLITGMTEKRVREAIEQIGK